MRRGTCVAWDYRSEGTFVFFLKRIDRKWALDARPLSRSNEEIDPQGDLWEEAITQYVKLAKLAPAKARRERARIVALGKQPDATEAQREISGDLEADGLSNPKTKKVR